MSYTDVSVQIKQIQATSIDSREYLHIYTNIMEIIIKDPEASKEFDSNVSSPDFLAKYEWYGFGKAKVKIIKHIQK